MRAVIDTNVLVSALLRGSTPRALLEQVRDGTVTLISSPALLADSEKMRNKVWRCTASSCAQTGKSPSSKKPVSRAAVTMVWSAARWRCESRDSKSLSEIVCMA